MIEDDEQGMQMAEHAFDFHMISKIKEKEKFKQRLLGIITIVLFLLLLLFIILYSKCNNHETPKKLIISAKEKAYIKIAQYGEDCSKHFTCGENAFCRYLQGTYRCDCKHGYYGDGIGNCKDGAFTIFFKNPTTKNIPRVTHVMFPESRGLSVCLWLKLNVVPTKIFTIFTYASYLVKGENDLMLTIDNKKQFRLLYQGNEYILHRSSILVNKWTHICWEWHLEKPWKFFVNGILKDQQKDKNETFKIFPESNGEIYLGQQINNGHIDNSTFMFQGEITEFFIYSRYIEKSEVTAAYQNTAVTKDTVISWWQFKNISSDNDIKRTRYPFYRYYIL